VRSNDRLISRIDELLANFWQQWNKRHSGNIAELIYAECELFCATDTWLKNCKEQNARKHGVMMLYTAAAQELANSLKVTINVLPRALEDMYGKDMVEHGRNTDRMWLTSGGRAFVDRVNQDPSVARMNPVYRDRAEVQKYRVFFRDGIAYQLPWIRDSATPVLIKLDTTPRGGYRTGTMSRASRSIGQAGIQRSTIPHRGAPGSSYRWDATSTLRMHGVNLSTMAVLIIRSSLPAAPLGTSTRFTGTVAGSCRRGLPGQMDSLACRQSFLMGDDDRFAVLVVGVFRGPCAARSAAAQRIDLHIQLVAWLEGFRTPTVADECAWAATFSRFQTTDAPSGPLTSSKMKVCGLVNLNSVTLPDSVTGFRSRTSRTNDAPTPHRRQ